ncbi:hypothetical protein LYSBPC_17900 [Lysinibacillus piscis]|uniref:Uncharacterized protein n=1 Tax=Lysinibacillus piscis TaxID=2518931 RepID=A0ABQ5NJX8_9BACI|nr:hypothetical protein LYSBPC_17900 [Lysinibacillus sp. KH24]
MNDSLLEVLGDYFVTHKLVNQGWEFLQFVKAWQQGELNITLKG